MWKMVGLQVVGVERVGVGGVRIVGVAVNDLGENRFQKYQLFEPPLRP